MAARSQGATPTTRHLPKLTYTSAVISESMRLFPPVYVIGREATTDLELGGYRVKRGYTVLMSQWVNHRDPKYFPDPRHSVPNAGITGWQNACQNLRIIPSVGVSGSVSAMPSR
jgi:cytochrome P450